MLMDRFGCEKELLTRQLFHIKQSRLVTEYVEKFAELVDQLMTYGHVIEPVYYAMRFIDGLRDDIRSAISLHRLDDFDTTASLALLQEDVGTYFRSTRKNDYSYAGKTVPKGPHPLLPPPRIDKAVPASVLLEEKKLCEGSHLKKRWLHFVLNIEQKDRVFAVLKSGVGNTNVLLQFSCMLCKSCWSSF